MSYPSRTAILAPDAAGRPARDQGLAGHMSRVYRLMSIGLGITAIVAWYLGSTPELFSLLHDPATLQPTVPGWIVILAPLGFIFVMHYMAQGSTSSGTLYAVFLGYAAVMGASLSHIVQLYTGASIVQVFLSTTIAFASLSLYGYATKRDLGPIGNFLVMGVIGLFMATVINIFLGSSALDYAVSVVGVLIFAGLTAHDTQKIKQLYLDIRSGPGGDVADKASIMGALTLYIDFINMFVLLLRLMADRK